MTRIESGGFALPRQMPAWAGWALLAAEWACVLAAGALWATERPAAGVTLLGGPLWAAAWACRWVRLGQPTRPTPLDWPLLAFMMTALVGLWAAPDRAIGLVRLNFFLGAVGIYYGLANSPTGLRAGLGYGLGALAALLAMYFASQHDWTSGTAKFAVVGQLGQMLNHRVPQLGLYQPNPNVIANLLALVLPVPVLLAWCRLAAWRHAGLRRLATLLAALSALVIVFGLAMTESRGSVLALAGAIGLAAWWWLAGRLGQRAGRLGQRAGRLGQRAGRGRLPIFAAGVAAMAVVAGLVTLAAPNFLTLALGSLPGPNSAISRAELFGQVWRLARDTPFTGGGLGSFPGLYSTYILDVPNLYLTHAHNAFLNVLVEQGWPGLVSFVLVLSVALSAGLRRLHPSQPGEQVLVAAGLLGLAVVVLQGLGDGTLVASRVALAWLIPAGLAVGAPMVQTKDTPEASAPWPSKKQPARLRWLLAGLAGVGCLGLLTWHGWLSAWFANMASLQFARIQLAGWPTNTWSDGYEAPRLAFLQPEFDQALSLNPTNVTALYRLGLLASVQRDYSAAVRHLAQAHAADPGHRGILKALAYAYVWTGDTQDARPLLRSVPEAANEMTVYTWWWGTQGRPDLAHRAGLAAAELAAAP